MVLKKHNAPQGRLGEAQMTNEHKNMEAQRLLISGASGMLGSALRAALVLRGVELVQLVRREPKSREEIEWDPAAPSPIAEGRVLEGFDDAFIFPGPTWLRTGGLRNICAK